MNKFVITMVIILAVLSQLSGIEKSDFSIKRDFKQWDLVKTVPESVIVYEEYELEINTKPYKLSLMDKQGNVIWTKSNLRAGTDLAFFAYDSKKAIVDYNKIPNGYKTGTMDIDKVVDGKGNCLLMDKSYNRYVLVNKHGGEVLFPPNTAGMQYMGMLYDKYLVFYQWDFQDFRSKDKNNEEYAEYGTGNPNFNLKTRFTEVYNTCVVFDMTGSLVKQFKLPDVGVVQEGDIYFDENMKYSAYKWWNPETDTNGYTLMSTTGEVFNVGKPRYFYSPSFSEDGKLWIPHTQNQDIEILDTKTGERAFILEGMWPNGAALSSKETGYLLYTLQGYTAVIDYRNLNMLFYQQNSDARFSDPWISEDGKEIRFTYQEKDKPAEVRFYRMK